VTRGEQLSFKWSDGIKKNILRASFSLGRDYIGQRIMDFGAWFVKIRLREIFLS